VGCSGQRIEKAELRPQQQLVVPDDSVVHALDTRLETHLVDQLELDTFLRDRDIRVRVIDGVVAITGEVWTPLEKERVGELVRRVAGVVDVSNELDVHPPRR
jgi:osmotically-inducible protein OsmY